MKTGRILTAAAVLIALASCSGHFKVDMRKDRDQHIKHDLAILNRFSQVDIPDRLSLEDAVRIGLQNNLDLRISRIMAEISDEESLREKLNMLPQLNVNAQTARRSEYNQTEYVDSDTGQTVLSNTITEELTSRSANATLTWNLLDFGISYFKARQAVLKSEIQRMERVRQAQNLAFDIASAYWKAVLAEKSLKKISEMEKETSGYKEKAEAMVAQKRLDPMVAKTIEKDLASMAVTSKNLQAEISGARIELCKLMGVRPAREFSLARESFQDHLETMPAPSEIDPETLETAALNRRPELFAADLEERVSRDQARAALASMFPGIKLNYGYSYNGNEYLVNNVWSTVGAGLMDNLLSLPARYADFQAKGLNVDLIKMQRLMLSGGVIAQTRLALHDYRVKRELFELQDNSYRISEELLDMARQRHELGALSDTVMIQNMMENMVAKLGRDRSLIELLNAYNSLLVTVGLDFNDWKNGVPSEDTKAPGDINTKDIPELENEFRMRPGQDTDTGKSSVLKPAFEKETACSGAGSWRNINGGPVTSAAQWWKDGIQMNGSTIEMQRFPAEAINFNFLIENITTKGGVYV